MAAEHASESTPLLRPAAVADDAVDNDAPRPKSGRRSETFIVLILGLAIVMLATGDELIQPAQTRILEAIYCQQYYAVHDPSLIGSDGSGGVAERYCKNHVVQGDVAMLKGWLVTIEAFVMLLVSVPWGYAADAYGRRPVAIILTVGLFLKAAYIQAVCFFWKTIPINAIWGAAGFAVLGGGSSITTAIIFTIVADVIPQERRASTFFQIAGLTMFTQVIGPIGSAALMKLSPWVPMLLGLAFQLLVIAQVLLLPETKGYLTEPSAGSGDAVSETGSTCSSKHSPLQNLKLAVKDSITFLAADTRLLLLIPAFFIHMLVMSRDVLLQYVSTRYSLSLSNATFILTLCSGWTLVLMLALYPSLNYLLRTKFAFHPQLSDLYVSRFCVVASGFGFLLIAWAPSLPLLIAALAINTLGIGMHLYLRSLATSFVETHHVARLMTFISWIDTIGLMICSPFMAWLFERGVELRGLWMGLPFLFCASVYAILAVLLGMVSLGGWQLEQEQAERRDEEPLLGTEE